MKILLLHNHYKERGGEDVVVEAETRLLRERGNEVVLYSRSNDELEAMPAQQKIRFMFKDALWNPESYAAVRDIAGREKPDVAHVHNVFVMLSPAVYAALWEAKIPVVQTLHNYRFLCPKATLYRDGKICEKCTGGDFYYSVLHRCWRGSAVSSFFLQRILQHHRRQGTLTQKIERYIALTEFSKSKLVQGGWDPERIVVKSNFVNMTAKLPGAAAGTGALFVGRLADGKGLNILLEAWNKIPGVPLKIIGDGELKGDIERRIGEARMSQVTLVGRQSNDAVRAAMTGAAFLIFPSVWYECFPVTIVEAFASGLPVIASRLGAMAEIIRDGETGLFFNPADPLDLAARVRWAWEHPEEMKAMGKRARDEYERKYTPEKNYQALMTIYQSTIQSYRKMRGLETRNV